VHTVEIPERDWRQRLDQFSAQHEGWLVSLELLAADLGAQPEIHDLPLRGVTAEAGASGPVITISAGSTGADQITHTIHAPTHVRIERTVDDADVALEIEATDQTTAILRFRTAARPDTVDGTPRHM
jgi:Family of unknown function (DUF5335)